MNRRMFFKSAAAAVIVGSVGPITYGGAAKDQTITYYVGLGRAIPNSPIDSYANLNELTVSGYSRQKLISPQGGVLAGSVIFDSLGESKEPYVHVFVSTSIDNTGTLLLIKRCNVWPGAKDTLTICF